MNLLITLVKKCEAHIIEGENTHTHTHTHTHRDRHRFLLFFNSLWTEIRNKNNVQISSMNAFIQVMKKWLWNRRKWKGRPNYLFALRVSPTRRLSVSLLRTSLLGTNTFVIISPRSADFHWKLIELRILLSLRNKVIVAKLQQCREDVPWQQLMVSPTWSRNTYGYWTGIRKGSEKKKIRPIPFDWTRFVNEKKTEFTVKLRVFAVCY